jgi:GT2 family glycosyltransferase
VQLPSVTIVFLVFNRREQLRESLRRTLYDSTYPSELVDVIVIDNASTDGSADMVHDEFPDVQLIRREENIGVSAWNDGFEAAGGDYVLALDDDCYLPPDGLERAVAAALENDADLVSFGVASTEDSDYRFDRRYRTGLLMFWGCAVLMRRRVVEDLEGYDPRIFVLANELEFSIRFFDRGFRHLHLPEVVALHMKAVDAHWSDYIGARAYTVNSRHFAYIAGKLLHRRDAFEVVLALALSIVRDGVRIKWLSLRALPGVLAGFWTGLRHREPVASQTVSRTYRLHFHGFASPWLSHRAGEFVFYCAEAVARAVVPPLRRRPPTPRRARYFAARPQFYPADASTLQLVAGPCATAPSQAVQAPVMGHDRRDLSNP